MSKNNDLGDLTKYVNKLFDDIIKDLEEGIDDEESISLEEYKEKTGKRFRMTKEQKSRGLSREEAFKEFLNL
tara:strand:+ start:1080 stop:1295 length:216 start_codon:yes stop_codon:yes gene_type:complete